MVDQRPMSFEEFDARYAGKRYEYVDGKPLPRAPEITLENGEIDVQPKTMQHLFLSARLGYLVGKHIIQHHLGVPLMSGVGFFMTRTPPELREADFAFITPEQASGIKVGEWMPFPPAFAAEIVTEWDSEAYIQRKSHSYMANGCGLLWVIYPTIQQVHVHRPDEAVRVCGINDTVDGGDVLRGLELEVRALFTGNG